MAAIVWWLAACCLLRAATAGNPDAKRLYDDLLSNYNKLVRPVVNTTDVLRVCIKLKLSQLIDVVSVARVNTACRADLHRAGCTANAYLALARRIWNLNRHESHQRLGSTHFL
ncbi:acetylcholine receptor subunit alpha-like [Ostrinia furnacalis]|uniref:acetylcholine receptor subunit alpha-like n=1 Tax=Ostrinia furnacalis TaxID=93504 RepID=UPI00103D4C10|nr:acetylcholine receptor subunit alpha-like [Ostrinia furnacalis]